MVIKHAVILRRSGEADLVRLVTDLPSAYSFEIGGPEPLAIQFSTPKGQAEAYLTKHFPGVRWDLIEVPVN